MYSILLKTVRTKLVGKSKDYCNNLTRTEETITKVLNTDKVTQHSTSIFKHATVYVLPILNYILSSLRPCRNRDIIKIPYGRRDFAVNTNFCLKWI